MDRTLREAHALAWAERIKHTAERRDGYVLAAIVVCADGRAWALNRTSLVGRSPSHHAEVRALRRLGGIHRARGATVYVARSTADGAFANARPCADCERFLRCAGVARVVYTAGDGEFGTIKFGRC